MASISTSAGGLRTIQFMSPDQTGKRKSIRLGKVSKRVAEEIKVKVEALVASKVAGVSWDGETARWVAALGDEMAARLGGVGLIPPRQQAAAVKLGAFLAEHIASRTDVKEGTAKNLQMGA